MGFLMAVRGSQDKLGCIEVWECIFDTNSSV